MSEITSIERGVTVKDSRETINSNFANLDERVETLENRKIVSNEGNWEAGEAVEVGDIRFLGGRDNAGYILECVQAGTTGAEQPTFNENDIVGEFDPTSIDLNQFVGVLDVDKGGTGADNAKDARTNLGLSTAIVDATIDGQTIVVTKADNTVDRLRIEGIARLADMADYVVQHSRNGTEWYRLWKSGWIEQGGYISSSNTSAVFSIPFADTNYTLLTGSHRSGEGTSGNFNYVKTYSTTGFTHNFDSKQYVWWYACGLVGLV